MQNKHVNGLLTCAFPHLANRLKLYLWFHDYLSPQIKVIDMVKVYSTCGRDEKLIQNVSHKSRKG
jgi:hypothetical protein